MQIDIRFGVKFQRDGRRILPDERDRIVTRAITACAKAWGGCSVTEVDGAWVSPDGHLVREPGMVLTVLTEDRPVPTDQPRDGIPAVLHAKAIAEQIREGLNQEEVWVSVSNNVKFVIGVPASATA